MDGAEERINPNLLRQLRHGLCRKGGSAAIFGSSDAGSVERTLVDVSAD